MPWKSQFQNGKWKVVSLTNGSVKGTHPTKAKADAQVRALYANTPEGKRGGGMVYKNNLPATSPTRPSTLGQASTSSQAGLRHGGSVPKGMPPAGKPGQPMNAGMPVAKKVKPMEMRHGGPMPMKGYKGGQGLNPANPGANPLTKTAIGKQGAVAPGMRHGGMPGMAYPSQGPNHEGQLPAVTPPTTKLQQNVTGKGGAVLPGMRKGGTPGYRHGGEIDYRHGGKTDYRGGGEVVPGSGPSKKGLPENESGPGTGTKKRGVPFTGGPGGAAEIPAGQAKKSRYLMQPG